MMENPLLLKQQIYNLLAMCINGTIAMVSAGIIRLLLARTTHNFFRNYPLGLVNSRGYLVGIFDMLPLSRRGAVLFQSTCSLRRE